MLKQTGEGAQSLVNQTGEAIEDINPLCILWDPKEITEQDINRPMNRIKHD